MKKLWVAMVFMVALVCWGSAGAKDLSEEWYRGWAAGCNCDANTTYAADYEFVDSAHHAVICTNCSTQVGLMGHHENCAFPGRCLFCEANGVELAGTSHEPEYKDLGYTHQKVCKYCEVALDEVKPHQSNCDDPTYCFYCWENVTISEDYIQHRVYKYVDLGNGKCQQQCTECHMTRFEPQQHLVWCDKPTKCANCKADNLSVSKDQLAHGAGELVDLGDGTHTFRCKGCGENSEVYDHYASCLKPGVCGACGAVVPDLGVSHRWYTDGPFVDIDPVNHYVECIDCGALLGVDHNFDDNCTCIECGYEATSDLPGDADNNSSVTLADVRAILSGSVSSEANADVTGDGSVNEQDVLRIMQYISGWNVTLQ